jgi:hypothetical protein
VSDGRWRISVTAPDWGEDHLSPEAVVAFVDDELDPGPRGRATRHAARCRECAAQVVAQTQARVALRTAAGPPLPSSLLSSLRSIPQQTDLPAPPADLAVNRDGQIVCRSRPEPAPRRRRPVGTPPVAPSLAASRPGPVTPAAALGVRPRGPQTPDRGAAHAVDPADADPAGLDRADRPAGLAAVSTVPAVPTVPGHRPGRMRVGTGVAVSGLALGALAFGITAAAPSVPAPSVERGVLGGPVLGGSGTGPAGLAEARLRLGTSARPDPTPGAVDRGALRGLW